MRMRIMLGVIACVIVFAGCRAKDFEERWGFEMNLPDGWTPRDARTVTFPGQVLGAWDGPGQASLGVYATLPDPGGTAGSVLEDTRNRWLNFPGWNIVEHHVESIAGFPGAWLEVIAPGNGAALFPKAADATANTKTNSNATPTPTIPTRRVLVAVVRNGGTVHFVWHCPESEYPKLQPLIKQILTNIHWEPDPDTAVSAP